MERECGTYLTENGGILKNKSAWNEIASAVADTRSNLQVDARRVRERTHLLIDQHKKSNADSLKSSGIDEEYGEKETLLDEILSLVEDEEKQKKKNRKRKRKQKKIGEKKLEKEQWKT
ncbi:Hypothetical predicted protein [Mytilus galloprovincialis]|uniref:Uncharacterized protein n=1 Tax=Mytilus galloprovincialis TaxID=29158 RepID=A0A8B6CZV1_MYTGA|nr:Hypothetical predicted protein [Mytilus galloprovincialis]